MSLTNIPADLIYDIFLLLDSHRTLSAFIKTNRLLYEIFKAYSNIILRQVLCNGTGIDIQVLPYALATSHSRSMPITEELTERDIQPQKYLMIWPTRSSIWNLETAHATVQGLAKHYSIRFKEGRILRDTLTAEESRRFHIAAHLFFHYQTIWRAFQQYAWEIFYSDSDSDSQGSRHEAKEIDVLEDAMQDDMTTDVCDSFLAGLSTDELLWIQEFSNFLLQDIDRTLNFEDKYSYPFTDYRNRCNLELSVDSWRHFLLSRLMDQLGRWGDVFRYNGPGPTYLQQEELWLIDALSRVLQARAVNTEANEEKILTSKGILIPACQKCSQRPEKHVFFNKTNLEEFTDHWGCTHFPEELSRNPFEKGRALRRIHTDPDSLRVGTTSRGERIAAIREIMAHAEAQAASLLENGEVAGNGLMLSDDEGESDHLEVKTAATGYKWSPDDVLCLSCFSAIFRKLYYAWWLDERQTDRVEPHAFSDEPCWWGIECRKQDDDDHASRRDHCCPRTKGVMP